MACILFFAVAGLVVDDAVSLYMVAVSLTVGGLGYDLVQRVMPDRPGAGRPATKMPGA